MSGKLCSRDWGRVRQENVYVYESNACKAKVSYFRAFYTIWLLFHTVTLYRAVFEEILITLTAQRIYRTKWSYWHRQSIVNNHDHRSKRSYRLQCDHISRGERCTDCYCSSSLLEQNATSGCFFCELWLRRIIDFFAQIMVHMTPSSKAIGAKDIGLFNWHSFEN